MDIDIFYTRNSGSFGADGYKNFVDQFSWPTLNASGPEQQTLNAYRRQMTPKVKSDCLALSQLLSQVKSEIDQLNASKITAKGAAKKEIESKVSGLEKAKNEIQTAYNNGKCELKLQDQEQANLLNMLSLNKGTSSNTGKYMLFGSIGIVALIAGVVIFKRLNKK